MSGLSIVWTNYRNAYGKMKDAGISFKNTADLILVSLYSYMQLPDYKEVSFMRLQGSTKENLITHCPRCGNPATVSSETIPAGLYCEACNLDLQYIDPTNPKTLNVLVQLKNVASQYFFERLPIKFDPKPTRKDTKKPIA